MSILSGKKERLAPSLWLRVSAATLALMIFTLIFNGAVCSASLATQNLKEDDEAGKMRLTKIDDGSPSITVTSENDAQVHSLHPGKDSLITINGSPNYQNSRPATKLKP